MLRRARRRASNKTQRQQRGACRGKHHSPYEIGTHSVHRSGVSVQRIFAGVRRVIQHLHTLADAPRSFPAASGGDPFSLPAVHGEPDAGVPVPLRHRLRDTEKVMCTVGCSAAPVLVRHFGNIALLFITHRQAVAHKAAHHALRFGRRPAGAAKHQRLHKAPDGIEYAKYNARGSQYHDPQHKASSFRPGRIIRPSALKRFFPASSHRAPHQGTAAPAAAAGSTAAPHTE